VSFPRTTPGSGQDSRATICPNATQRQAGGQLRARLKLGKRLFAAFRSEGSYALDPATIAMIFALIKLAIEVWKWAKGQRAILKLTLTKRPQFKPCYCEPMTQANTLKRWQFRRCLTTCWTMRLTTKNRPLASPTLTAKFRGSVSWLGAKME